MGNVVLHEFVAEHREEIVRRCRATVATRSIPSPTDAEINHGVPFFLDQLVDALRLGQSSTPETGRNASLHGHDLLRQGFSVYQVVHDYGDVCQSITGLAVEMGAPISTDGFRSLNRCLDDAIAGAVTEYGRARHQSTLDGESARGSERIGLLALELRKLTNTAMLAFDVLKTGNIGVSGSTGAVLQRSLSGIGTLIGRSLAEGSLTERIQREPVLVSAFIEELAPAAALDATTHGITLAMIPVEDGVLIEADRQVLAAVIGDVLQHAFESTRPGTTATLRVVANAERVLIEIQSECARLGNGELSVLFPFEERTGDRAGPGLGLAFSLWGIEANHGRIYARNLPDDGCVFTVDLPRFAPPGARRVGPDAPRRDMPSTPRSDRRHPYLKAATTTGEDLVALARRTVHPHYVVKGMLTHCQCVTCGRVERALRSVAAGAEQDRDDALADTVLATRDATQGLATAARVVDEREAAEAQDRALVQQWREHAVVERADACAPRPMSPAWRSVHNHRGRVYDACANQLAATHPLAPRGQRTARQLAD
jgi:signal transduction histidine kinase